jgi:hypothetical protein
VPHQYLQIMFIGGTPLIDCNRLCGYCDLLPSRTRLFLTNKICWRLERREAWSAQ